MEGNILETIAAAARERVQQAKKVVSLEEIRSRALALPADTGFPFERALKGPDISFICECKKASPSRGLIAPDFPYREIALDYERAGASCISVLTEPQWFLGSDDYLKEIADTVRIPCIRKDFTVDEYMIYEARLLGAAAVLLICSLLDTETIRRYIEICDSLGLSALVEAHNENEIRSALSAGARIIGVNNRNLKDFSVDVTNSARLRAMVPEDVVFVAESGIKTAEDIDILRSFYVDAVLIGETLMRSPDKKAMLEQLRGGPAPTRVKVCGLMRPEDAQAVNEAGADMAGVILEEGFRRSVSLETARRIRKQLSPDIPLVGVFVDSTPARAASFLKEGIIDAVQLHGDEDEGWLEALRALTAKPVIKAMRAGTRQQVREALDFPAAHILLDSGTGTGQTFDWTVLEEADRPFILAGGLDADNVGDAVGKYHPWGVDVSSGVETDHAKDPEKIRLFVKAVREASSAQNAGRMPNGTKMGGEE